MTSPSDQLTAEVLVQWLIDQAGGVKRLSQATSVSQDTLKRWKRGKFPRQRQAETIELVHSWAVRELGDRYPPTGYPENGLLAFVGAGDAEGTGQLRGHEPVSIEDAKARSDHRGWRRPRNVAFGAGGLVLVLAVVAVLIYQPWRPQTATVVVSNKVAFGPIKYAEDTTPAYLSSRPVQECRKHGCELTGTEMWSGATLEVTCHIEGEQMTNYDTTSAPYGQNPNAYYSNEWYKARWPDGRTGYISYVYIAPADRSGMGLPRC